MNNVVLIDSLRNQRTRQYITISAAQLDEIASILKRIFSDYFVEAKGRVSEGVILALVEIFRSKIFEEGLRTEIEPRTFKEKSGLIRTENELRTNPVKTAVLDHRREEAR